MIRFTEAHKRDVVSTDAAETLGRVDRFVVDVGQQRVTALKLSKVAGDAQFVSWSDLTRFGQDAVTVPSADVLREPQDPREEGIHKKRNAVLGKRVLSDAGRELGEVAEVEFDADTGRIATLITASEQIEGTRLLGNGSYALVVRA